MNPDTYDREIQERRDRMAAAVVQGYLASYANSTVNIAKFGLPTPERIAEVVSAYTDAILKELDR